MGIIIKQTIRATIWSYIGVVIGFITITYIYTRFLTPNIVGLFALLIAYATVYGRLANFGMLGVTNRMFSHFRNKENGHNGFLFVALLFHLVGLIIFLSFYYGLKSYLIATNIEDSPLFAKYYYLLIPITLSTALFLFLDTFNKVLYNAVFGTFVQDFLQRWFLLAITFLFAVNILNLNQLIISYAIAVSIKAFILLFYLIKKKEINLRPNLDFIDKPMWKEIRNVALINIVAGFGSMIVFQLDKIIINQMLNLEVTGVYSIAFYFGSLVVLPSRPLLKISGTLIADAFKENDLETIKDIYYKSCLNQLIIGGFLLLGIWANIDNILSILGEDYIESKWVIIFIGIGYLIDMTTGTNGLIISFSRYYKVAFTFVFWLIAIEVISLYFLIPAYGIVGAALAIAIALFINNLMRYIFLFNKFAFQPFNSSFIKVILIYTAIFFALTLLPQQQFIVDIILRGGFIVAVSLLTFWFIPISPDIKAILEKLVNTIKLKS